MLAAWVQGGWLFLTPLEGWRAFGRAEAALRIWDGENWIRDSLNDIKCMGVNSSFDTTNRFALSSPATLRSHEGSDLQLKVNKATAGDTASLLFQTDWSGRVEMGTAGDDDFTPKVSPDGSLWHEAMVVARASGQAQFPNGAEVSGALTGSGAANLPALMSDASDTGTISTAQTRSVVASDDSRASSSTTSVVASSNSHAAGARSRVGGSTDCQAAVFQCVVVASRGVLNTVNRLLAMGNVNAAPSPANRSIHLFGDGGNIQIAGSLTSSHTFSDFAEMFPNGTGVEIPLGTLVTEDAGAVRPAGPGDEIAGVVTATAVVTAGDTPFAWQGRYLSDEWGRPLYDTAPDPDHVGDGPAPLIERRKENPAWNPDAPQIPRSERPASWTRVGLLGQVFTRVAADVVPGDRLSGVEGIGVRSTSRTGLRCMTITQPFDAAKGYAIARCLVNIRV